MEGVGQSYEGIDWTHVPVAAEGHRGSGVQQTPDRDVVGLQVTNLLIAKPYKTLEIRS